jgi:hypothetical protein
MGDALPPARLHLLNDCHRTSRPEREQNRTQGLTSVIKEMLATTLGVRTGLDTKDSWRKIAFSNNVGSVKHDVRTRLHALVEERHFAFVDYLRFPTLARF